MEIEDMGMHGLNNCYRVGAIILLALVVCGLPASVSAHKLKVFAAPDGEVITGYVYFPGGGKGRHMRVDVRGPEEKLLGECTTDDEGNFTYMPASRCDHTFVVETEDGHRADFMVSCESLPPGMTGSAPPVGPEPPEKEGANVGKAVVEGREQADIAVIVEQAVARQLRPLREELERYEERRRFRDILGGMGFIAGLCGVAFYFLGVRRKESKPE